MKVNEIFKSIQGEGLYSGAPAVFVRLAGCNLACEWCDTKYALQGEFRKLCYKEVVSEVSMTANPPTIVCFTGGEPMVDRSREFRKILDYLKIRGYQIHIETNGTIQPGKRKIPYVDFWSVSPKLHCDFEEKYPPGKTSYLEAIKSICMLEAEKQLKFVVAKEEDVPLITKLIIDLKLPDEVVRTLPIVIQPERFSFALNSWALNNQHRLDYLDKMKSLIPWCEKHLGGLNWRVLPQLHYLLWKGERGV